MGSMGIGKLYSHLPRLNIVDPLLYSYEELPS